MDKKLREITDRLHNEAQARYALALDAEYHKVAAGMSRASTVALRNYVLAILGSPYLRVTNRRWNDNVIAWLETLGGGCYAAQHLDGVCFACGHARALHNQDIGNGQMSECSECGCHGFTSSTDDEMLAQFND